MIQTNFRPGEMVQYQAPDMPRWYYVMIKEVITNEGDLGGLYRCFAISPGFTLTEDVSDFLPGKYLTRVI
jgi:hypothetical protein